MISSGGNDSVQSDAALADRLASIKTRMEEAARKAGRRPSDIALVAVTKTVAVPVILSAFTAGQRVFGENRVQEAASKWPVVKLASGGSCGTAFSNRSPDIELHLIGPLQTNKLQEAIGLFDVLHTLDRERLAVVLATARERGTKLPRLFIQVNIGEEPQKAGVAPSEADDFIKRCREVHGLIIEGLMCIPPVDEDPARYFALLQAIAGRNDLDKLSCGMSGDFETAISFGATHVRVGSAIFGARG